MNSRAKIIGALLLLPACGQPPPATEASASAVPIAASPTAPAATSANPDGAATKADRKKRAEAALSRLNNWCKSTGDDCAVHAGDGPPNRVPSGETGGMVTDTQERLRALGYELKWTGKNYQLRAPSADHAAIEQLIDALAGVNAAGIGFSPSVAGLQFLPLKGAGNSGMVLLGQPPPQRSELMSRLVAAGLSAVKPLSDHLDDARKTQLSPMQAMMWTGFDELDFNKRLEKSAPAMNVDHPPGAVAPHQITVGDLCFVALGQILNRSWAAVRYQPTGGLIISSPTSSTELLKATREVVAKIDDKAHFQRLLADVRHPDYEGRRIGALQRLRFYYPKQWSALADEVLALPRYNVFAIQALVNQQLYSAPTAASARKRFDAFVAKAASGTREGIEQHLFADLANLEAKEEGRVTPPPNFNSEPRDLLIQLFGHPTDVRSSARPWPKAISESARERLVKEVERLRAVRP